MKKSLAVVLVIFLAFAGAAIGAMYAYDRSRADVISDGISAAGFDLSGLSADEATAVLEQGVRRPLSRPLTIRYGQHGVLLSARAAGIEVDVDGTVAHALERSRSGSFLTRSWRDLNGEGVEEDLPLEITYSATVVDNVVTNLKETLYVKPREAKVATSATGVRVLKSRTGREVRERQLERRIVSHLVRAGQDRVVQVPVKMLEPKVTTTELREKFSRFIGISRDRFELRLFVNLRLAKVYPISVGRIGYDTPTGLYNVRNKAVNPSWFVPNKPWAGKLAGKVIPPGPDNPIKARWMGIYNGAGIHGTDAADSIGQRASHGCIRMLIPDVVELYEKVPVGTPVYIA
jgi:L,D-transpeptidase catalytic domain/Putative peptidoglycan binding domain